MEVRTARADSLSLLRTTLGWTGLLPPTTLFLDTSVEVRSARAVSLFSLVTVNGDRQEWVPDLSPPSLARPHQEVRTVFSWLLFRTTQRGESTGQPVCFPLVQVWDRQPASCVPVPLHQQISSIKGGPLSRERETLFFSSVSSRLLSDGQEAQRDMRLD